MKVSKSNCGASVKPAYYMGGYMKAHKSKFGKSDDENSEAKEENGVKSNKGGYAKKKKK